MISRYEGLRRAARRASATLVFAIGGQIIGHDVFGISASQWKLAAGAGIGALINLAYRWAESAIGSSDRVDMKVSK